MIRSGVSPYIVGLLILMSPMLLMLFGRREETFVGLALYFALALLATFLLFQNRMAILDSILEQQNLDSTHALLERLRQLHREVEVSATESRNCEAECEDILGGIAEGCLILDRNLKILRANHRALDFLGFDKVLGLRLTEVERNPELLESTRKVLSGNRFHSLHLENPRGVWEIRLFSIASGKVLILMDEIGLRRRAAELRQRFVQDLAHELRSPLTVIRTTVETLVDELPESASSRIVRQIERITRLTEELHELASIETGEMELEPKTQSLQSLMREIVNDFRPLAERAKVELLLENEPDISWCFDRRALGRILSNLVDNAIKYNRPGGWVRLSARREPDGLALEVVDSGRGIPPEELGAVTQRFYRVDRARTPGEAGLGLGLAIVKHLVQRMGGEIHLDSTEDVETRFQVKLPLQILDTP